MINRYNIPDISIESSQNYDHRSKYRNLYIKLIDRCKLMTKDELNAQYTEKHHILPKCMGGKDEDDNIIVLPIRYHIMAHLILLEAYPDIQGLSYAILILTNGGKSKTQFERNSIVEKRFSSRLISRIREESIKKISGKNNPNYGKPRSEDFKKLMSQKFSGSGNPMYGRRGKTNPNYGKPLSEERKAKISKSLMGKHQSLESNIKRSNSLKGDKAPNYGKKLPESTRKKISDNHADVSGGNNGRAMKVISPEGIVFDTIKEAAKSIGISKLTLSKWVRGLTKNNHGWNLIKDY